MHDVAVHLLGIQVTAYELFGTRDGLRTWRGREENPTAQAPKTQTQSDSLQDTGRRFAWEVVGRHPAPEGQGRSWS